MARKIRNIKWGIITMVEHNAHKNSEQEDFVMDPNINTHLAALKIVAALYRQGLINLPTYRKIIAQYGA